MINNSMVIAATKIKMAAQFFSMNTEMKLRVLDRSVRIRNTLPMMSDEKAMALTSPSVWPSLMERK